MGDVLGRAWPAARVSILQWARVEGPGASDRDGVGLRGGSWAGSGLSDGTGMRRPSLGNCPQVKSDEFRQLRQTGIGPTFRQGV